MKHIIHLLLDHIIPKHFQTPFSKDVIDSEEAG